MFGCSSRAVIGVGLSIGAMAFLGQQASAGVVLESGAGPAATFSGTASKAINFTTEGDYAWVYFAGTSGNSPASPAFQKSTAPNAFSALVGLTPTGTTTVGSSRTGNTANGVTAAVTTTDSASTNLTSLPGYTYVSSSASSVGNGMRTTYTMPANSVQLVSVYCYTLSGVFGRMQVTQDDGTVTSLFDDGTSGVQLPASIAQSTKGGGVYQFELRNDDNVARPVTFAYTIAAYPSGVTGGQIGFEGITVAAVPEPATFGVVGLAAAGLLLRRRRAMNRS